MALRDVAKPTLRHLEKEFHTFLYFPLHNGERTCPATVRSTTSSWMSEMLHPRDARVDFLYYHWRWNLMQRSWSHVDCQWSNWCTRSLQGVLRIYSDSFFF